jgi:hypothetical protein
MTGENDGENNRETDRENEAEAAAIFLPNSINH